MSAGLVTAPSEADATSAQYLPNTPVASTSTPVPPANTPTGGNEGAGVRPPNTGSGGAGTGYHGLWVMALGALLLAVGGGTLAIGSRRRS